MFGKDSSSTRSSDVGALSTWHRHNRYRLLALALLPVAYVAFTWSGRSSSSEDVLRAQFHIPDDVAFSQSVYPARNMGHYVEGIVTFTPPQYDAYQSSLGDPQIWKAEPFASTYLTVVPPFSPRALTWEDLPKPLLAGNARVRWGNLSFKTAATATSGKVLCIALRFPPGQRKASWVPPVAREAEARYPLETPARLDGYNAIACAEMGRAERPRGYILGQLNADTQTLHMIVH
ncbi:MAG: hypothetical protein ACK5JT_12040 [Hyphomicrobiaceae bacterium]